MQDNIIRSCELMNIKKSRRKIEAINFTMKEKMIVSKQYGYALDYIDPKTGLTEIYQESLDDVRRAHPDAEIMLLDDWVAWKAEQQRTPVTWEAATEDEYHEMLNVLPPRIYGSNGFLVGEPGDHEADTGEGRYAAYTQRGGEYLKSSRPMTVREFKEHMQSH